MMPGSLLPVTGPLWGKQTAGLSVARNGMARFAADIQARRNDMRRIRYRFKKNPGVWGLAFPEQWRIELDPNMTDKTQMDIAIHEAVHVICPYLTEDVVNSIGVHAADLLWRLGYRKPEGD